MTLRGAIEARCIVCQLAFCCSECRWHHEQLAHGLTYDCPICRGNRFLCRPEHLSQEFIQHLSEEHFPLQCKRCNKFFDKMEDFRDINVCNSISELIDKDNEMEKETKEVEYRFDSLYDTVENTEGDNFEGIISADKSNKTAVITPIVRRKNLVDYESSDTELDSPKSATQTPHPNTPHPRLASKLKPQRAATPHAKKYLYLVKQKAIEDYEDTINEENLDDLKDVNKTTPSRNNNITIPDNEKEITTPTSHVQVLKLSQAVTTSTPTHPVTEGWTLFPEQSADSPLSEIENPESPAQSINKEVSKSDSDVIPPKLKSIIAISRTGPGQDSSEKHISFQDSANTETSIKTKKVKFADDTVFEQEPKTKRVFRKPKRMLTPGPQKPKSYFNPRFQALVNRFESQAITLARTPVNKNKEIPQEDTPPVGDHNIPARTIDFKEDTVESRDVTRESNESYKTCVESPDKPINNAITALTTNIAGALHTCLNSVLRTTEEETEIQFKFVITKRKVSVKSIERNDEIENENTNGVDKEPTKNRDNNLFFTVARAVKNVFWGDQASSTSTTPYKSIDSNSSSGSKRKFEELSDSELSPLNHKRHKYEGRIRGRPPLHRAKGWPVAALRSTRSDEHHTLLGTVASSQEDELNQSF